MLSTLNILDNIDRHPAADRLLLNFIRYAQCGADMPLTGVSRDLKETIRPSYYRPVPYSPYKKKWALSGPVESVSKISDALFPDHAGLEWKDMESTEDFISFYKLYATQGGLCYARGKVYSPDKFSLKLSVGSDGPCKIWVDGKVMGQMEVSRNPAGRDSHVFPLSMDKGKHEIVVAMERRGGAAWGFFLRLARTDSQFTKAEMKSGQALLPIVDP